MTGASPGHHRRHRGFYEPPRRRLHDRPPL